ncbi:response regulator [soil metagenome]
MPPLQSHEHESPERQESPNVARLMRFALIEDDEDHAHLVKMSLDRERIANKVIHLSDGEKAMEYLLGRGIHAGRELPDIILLDLKLPKIDGHQILRIVKENDELMAIPVVIMTTSRAEADRAKAYQHHANSYVVKPINFSRFRQMVKDLSLYWGVWNTPVRDG